MFKKIKQKMFVSKSFVFIEEIIGKISISKVLRSWHEQ